MMTKNFFIAIVCTLIVSIVSSCTYEKPEVSEATNPTCNDYPDEVAAILVNKCATAGCHNSKSYEASSGLDLSNWAAMKKGNYSGAVVIPGNTEYSTLFTFCNTFDDLGFTGQLPKMPVNKPPLSHDEMVTLKSWINDGAKNRCGELMFPFDASRRKFLVTNQACDQIEVFDIKSRSVMKFFEVGHFAGATPPESPHAVRYTPDGKYYLIAFYSSLNDTSGGGSTPRNFIQRFDAVTDEFIDEVDIAKSQSFPFPVSGRWGLVAISPDSKNAYAVDYDNHRIAKINLMGAMTSVTTNSIIDFSTPHGAAVNQDGSKLYITDQDNGCIYIASTTFPDINLPPQKILMPSGSSRGHEIIFSPDYSYYFVTCESPAQVLVYNTSNNILTATIPVGLLPQEFSLSNTKPYLFVSCTDDPYNGTKGSVCVIDYNSLTFVKKIATGTNPHGLVVDDIENVVYVANRNVDASGSTPHHSASCAGRNGYLTIIDMNTLELVPGFKYELGVNPYGMAIMP